MSSLTVVETPDLRNGEPPRTVVEAPAPGEKAARPQRIRGENLRRSLRAIIFAWIFGSFWAASTGGATATELAHYLGANDFLFGCLAAAPFLGTLLEIIGCILTQVIPSRKRIFLWTTTTQRLLYVPLALLPLFFAHGRSGGAVVMALLLLLAAGAGSMGGPAWNSWMSDLVPERLRGRYFARRSRMGIVVSLCTALGVGLLLDASHAKWLSAVVGPAARYSGLPPLVLCVSVIFLIAAACGTTDIQTFHRVHEPPMKAQHVMGWRAMFRAPLTDRAFLWYVLYLACFTFGVAFCGAFMWVMVLELLHRPGGLFSGFPDTTAYVMLLVAANIGQFCCYPLWGKTIDRMGRKPVIFCSSVLHSVTLLAWVFFAPGTLALGFFAAFFGGACSSGQEIANFNMMLRFNRQGGPGYQAVADVLVNAAGMFAGLSAGLLAWFLDSRHVHLGSARFGVGPYNLLFVVAVLVKCIGDFVVLPGVQDGGAAGLGQVFRNAGAAVKRRAKRRVNSDAYDLATLGG